MGLLEVERRGLFQYLEPSLDSFLDLLVKLSGIKHNWPTLLLEVERRGPSQSPEPSLDLSPDLLVKLNGIKHSWPTLLCRVEKNYTFSVSCKILEFTNKII